LRLRNIVILVAVLGVALGVYFATQPPEETTPKPDPVVYLWDYTLEELERIVIELPREDMRESFVKHEDQQWYFDYPSGPMANSEQWSGIPAILEGPVMNRTIAKNVTEEELTNYGFTPPSMTITLTTEDDEITNIEVGDASPSGTSYYLRLAESINVYTVDFTWYWVLERLVLDPPYPSEEEE